jgi:putative two-component system protein, hydrogenase maturation factor HypX/HoxX
MKILLLVHSFNSLSQRLHVELREAGHQLSVEFDINDAVTAEAVGLFQPELIIAPFLKQPIPPSIWRETPCLIIHPGPPGDRGPSALDWAILDNRVEWGVTVLQANEVMDGGPVWAFETFPMRTTTKGSLYRQEVTEAAVVATCRAIEAITTGHAKPTPQSQLPLTKTHREQPLIRQQQREINWQQDDQQGLLRKIRSADGSPGLLDTLFGRPYYLFDAHPEPSLKGRAGEIIARSGPAICRATCDDKAIWIGRLKKHGDASSFKLSATQLLADDLSAVPEVPHSLESQSGYPAIHYQQIENVGLLHFSFYNGAMGTRQCQQLQQALQQAKERNTQAILLLGGPDYWSNGMDLNQIEAAPSPADASWENIQAMDELALEIITTQHQLTISALQGNAGAGGVFLARASDWLWARRGVILNPHYKDMGNLYGSEYWSYLLPHYCGAEQAAAITQSRLPMGVQEGQRIGLVDDAFESHRDLFISRALRKAVALTRQPGFTTLIHEKQQRRTADETKRPLASYREEELEKMRMNFFGFDPSYHIARYNFIHKIPKSRTPVTLATHRRVSPS